MKILKSVWQFLTEKKVQPMTDTSIINTNEPVATPLQTVDVPATAPGGPKAEEVDVFEKLKALLIAAGHDIEKEWDLAVAYAKALVDK